MRGGGLIRRPKCCQRLPIRMELIWIHPIKFNFNFSLNIKGNILMILKGSDFEFIPSSIHIRIRPKHTNTGSWYLDSWWTSRRTRTLNSRSYGTYSTRRSTSSRAVTGQRYYNCICNMSCPLLKNLQATHQGRSQGGGSRPFAPPPLSKTL